MKSNTMETTNYGNWLGMKFIYITGTLGILFLVWALFSPALTIPAVVFLAIMGYFIYARHVFSYSGKSLQSQISGLLLDKLNWQGGGKALDIGCGNGALVIRLARKYPKASIIGIDNWGKGWEFSQSECERNAQLEGVQERVSFQQASASKIPFPDESFDVVISNLVFHEVMDAPDKRELIREALRVLKKGGNFVLQDLFLIEKYYGKKESLLDLLNQWGVFQVEFIESRNAPFIPKALKLPFMVGTLAMLVGQK
jgi:SAM-dependent methyltransferase